MQNTAIGKDRSRLALAVLWLALALWPLLAPNDYWLSLGGTFYINLILIASLNLLVGCAGQVSMAQAGFFGIGAYCSGILCVHFGFSPWLSTLCAVVISPLVSLLIGLPTLRLSGHYFAMATLGFNAILSVLCVGLVDWTGGPNGLIGVPGYSVGGLDLSQPGPFYLLAWALAGAVMLGLLNLYRSRTGRALRALSSSELAAGCLGVPVLRYKLTVLALCSALAGLAGALYAHQNLYISPDTFSFGQSILLLVMVAIGGFGRYWGPLFGALILTVLPELLRSWDDLELLLFGSAMVLVVGFVPGGLSSLWRRRGGQT